MTTSKTEKPAKAAKVAVVVTGNKPKTASKVAVKGVPRPPAAGRKAGTPNKVTKALKDMILGALDRAGGEDYLLEQAHANPNTFLSLIGKVLPTEIKATHDGGIILKVVTGIPRNE